MYMNSLVASAIIPGSIRILPYYRVRTWMVGLLARDLGICLPGFLHSRYGYVWVARMRPFWSPAETVIGGRSGLLRGPGRPSRPLLRPRGWSGATVSIQMGGGGAEDRGLRSVTCMGESSLEY